MEQTAQMFKALSEAVRLRILGLLAAEGELCVCDLMAVLALPQSTVSRHLAYLRNAGWVSGCRRGVWMYYRLSVSDSPFQQRLLAVLAAELAALDQARADREILAEYLRSKQATACE